MKIKDWIGAALLGWTLTAVSSCDDDDITIEPEPTQAEINFQKLESLDQQVDYYVFFSSAMDLKGIRAEGYAIEFPYIVVWWVNSAYRFNMNELISFEQNLVENSLTLYFP